MWWVGLVTYLVLLGLTIAAGRCDLRTGRVPNRLTYPAIVVGLVGWPLVGAVMGGSELAGQLSRAAWLGFASGAVPYLVLVLSAGLGMGDMKLMAGVGAVSASWRLVLATTVYALIAALVMSVYIMVRRGLVGQTLGRIVSAALSAGSRTAAPFPADGPKVPFAVAVAVGVAIAGAEQLLDVPTPWRAYSP